MSKSYLRLDTRTVHKDGTCAVKIVVAHGTNSKTVNPILEGIKIEAKGNEVTFFAIDLELYIRKTIHADVKQEGAVLLPGKLFGEYIGKIGQGQITFTSSDTTAVIEHGEGNDGNFSCMPINEYPDLINLNTKPLFFLKAADLREVINKTTPFTAQDNARPVLRGALFDVDATNNTLTAVALDGYRLARIIKPLVRPTGSAKLIIPCRALEEMRRMLTDDKEEIGLLVEKKFVQIAIGSTVFASRLIDGDFVNYRQIIPTEFNCNVVVETAPLLAAVGRAGLLSGTNKINLLTLTTADKSLELYANNEMGQINERVPANLDGTSIKIAFNSKYMFDALNTITDEFVKLSFTTPLAPCVVTSAKRGDYLFLVLPVRLG